MLPRQTELVHDILSLRKGRRTAEAVFLLVLDAEDAYWQIPLHPQEQKYYCGQLHYNGGTKYLAYTRNAQGSRGAPLSWAVIFGMICRCICSILRCPVVPDTHEMEVYVDDPIIALRGTVETVRLHVALAVVGWSVLGFSGPAMSMSLA